MGGPEGLSGIMRLAMYRGGWWSWNLALPHVDGMAKMMVKVSEGLDTVGCMHKGACSVIITGDPWLWASLCFATKGVSITHPIICAFICFYGGTLRHWVIWPARVVLVSDVGCGARCVRSFLGTASPLFFDLHHKRAVGCRASGKPVGRTRGGATPAAAQLCRQGERRPWR